MKNKLFATLIGMTLVIGTLTACGKDNTDEANQATAVAEDATEATNSEDEEAVGMGNPIEEVTLEKIVEVTGSKAVLPENASNPTYLLINNELGEIRFTLDSPKYDMTLRTQKLDEFTDITGMYYDWNSAYDETLCDYAARIMNYESDTDGCARAFLWYDADNKVMYSLATQADEFKEAPDMYGLAATMMQVQPSYDEEEPFDYPSNAMEERVGKTSFESYDEVIGYLEGTEAYALVKVKGYDGEVLLVADDVYDNLDGNMVSIKAVPYVMEPSGVVKADSLLSSDGTAYPISIGEDGLVYVSENRTIIAQRIGNNGTEDSEGFIIVNYISATEYDSDWNPLKVHGFHRDPEIANILENDSVDYDENDVEAYKEAADNYYYASPVNFTAAGGR